MKTKETERAAFNKALSEAKKNASGDGSMYIKRLAGVWGADLSDEGVLKSNVVVYAAAIDAECMVFKIPSKYASLVPDLGDTINDIFPEKRFLFISGDVDIINQQSAFKPSHDEPYYYSDVSKPELHGESVWHESDCDGFRFSFGLCYPLTAVGRSSAVNRAKHLLGINT